MRTLRIIEGTAVLIVCVLAASSVFACGPWFTKVLSSASDEELLVGPRAVYEEELKRIDPPVPARFKAVLPAKGDRWFDYYRDEDYARQTADADVADLGEALAALEVPQGRRKRLLDGYRAVRAVLRDHTFAVSDWREKGGKPDETPPPMRETPVVPEGLPAEFADYLRGAVLHHQGKSAEARAAWLALLERPEADRRYRSTWAAFMIGKTLLDENPADAVTWFAHVRELTSAGFTDSLGLASSSLGWEAKACLSLGRLTDAARLYVVQRATGDPTATSSLQRVAGKILNAGREELIRAAGDPTVRRVVTAYLIADGGPFHWHCAKGAAKRWVEAVEAAKVPVARDADRLAWAAYNVGEMDLAERWVRLAPAQPMTRWIRSKLLLRKGNVPEAMAELAIVVRSVPVEDDVPMRHTNFCWEGHQLSLWNEPLPERVRGELGALKLSRSDYLGALDLFMKGGYWDDAAYVAECVLTPDELIAVVNARWPEREDPKPPVMTRSGWWWRATPNTHIRHLLARRLTRIGRTREARGYFPSKWRPRLDAYVDALRRADDLRLDDADRAEHLWKAACITRYEGMELLGTELGPDDFVSGGAFPARMPSWVALPESDAFFTDRTRLLHMTRDQLLRERQHRVTPYQRFHYRYLACERAWRAAELMPDDSDETARVLCIAGSWLKDRDPHAADRFYKAVVVRCRRTELGREADRIRWFPKVDVDRRKLLE